MLKFYLNVIKAIFKLTKVLAYSGVCEYERNEEHVSISKRFTKIVTAQPI